MEVIKGLIVFKWENHRTISNNLVCGLNHFKRANYTHPLLFVKLN
jgi:hypothetical protein